MEGTEPIDELMRPVLAAIKRHVKNPDAITDIYNRAYEAVMTSMDVINADNKKLRLELRTLRFKESQDQRFIWWIWNVYSKSVMDTIAGIMEACTYQDEPTAAAGKYGLPIKCFDMMRRLTEYSHGICDGTYLDVQISTDVKTSSNNNKLDTLSPEYPPHP